jgi:hypothetical protein
MASRSRPRQRVAVRVLESRRWCGVAPCARSHRRLVPVSPRSRRGLRARFRQHDIYQRAPAWWELYTFTLFRQLGCTLTVDPMIPGTRRPDLLVTRDGCRMYVESKAMPGGRRAVGRRRSQLGNLSDPQGDGTCRLWLYRYHRLERRSPTSKPWRDAVYLDVCGPLPRLA